MKRIVKIFAMMLAILSFGSVVCACNNQGNSTDPTSEGITSENNTSEDSSSVDSAVDSPIHPTETVYVDAVKSPDYATISETINYTTYYIDAENGSDSNDGLSMDKAKKTLNAANVIVESIEADVPTKVLFKAGTTYEGTLELESYYANEEAPLIVSTYGETEEIPYAKIIAPKDGCSIYLKGDNVRISNFECTSEGGEGARGIYAITTRKGAAKNIVIKNNYIHDFNFRLGDYELPTGMYNLAEQVVTAISPGFSRDCGGIIMEAATPKAIGPSWFEGLWIDDNKIERVSRQGIWVNSYWAYRPGVTWGYNPYYDDDTGYYPNKKVYARGNEMLYTGGDAMVLIACRNSIVEYNKSFHAAVLGRSGQPNAGIWLQSCVDTVMQFNEAAYTHYRYDGEGFDIDIACSNILFQYNYSHHNYGGGLLLCNTDEYTVQYDKDGNYLVDEDGCPVQKNIAGDWRDVVIKNNVFVDNGWADVQFAGKVDSILFENNTIVKTGGTFQSNGMTPDTLDQGWIFESKDFAIGIGGTDWTIRNNIFYSRKVREGTEYKFDLSYCRDGKDGYTIENNIYYGFSDELETTLQEMGETNFRKIDPKFKSMEAGNGFEYAYGFVPTNAELYKNAAKCDILLKYDFMGNILSNHSYYGAIGVIPSNNG